MHYSHTDDIAVDWVTNKLYWTDSVWARIEALDLNTNMRVEVVSTGTNSVPRAIAVDPVNRYINSPYYRQHNNIHSVMQGHVLDRLWDSSKD